MGRKYGNRPTTVDGITFHSQAEALRYQYLKELEQAGKIRGLERQVRRDLLGFNGDKVCSYVSDFEYFDNRSPLRVIEDVKGHETEVFRLKWRWLKADFPQFIYKRVRVTKTARGPVYFKTLYG